MAKPRIVHGRARFRTARLLYAGALHQHQYPIIGVVTQPDRPKGRGLKEVSPPVKRFWLEFGLPVYQPLKSE